MGAINNMKFLLVVAIVAGLRQQWQPPTKTSCCLLLCDSKNYHRAINNMKFLLVVAIVAGVRAEADADADPQLLYGSPLVYGLGAHHAIGHLPVVKSVVVKPAEVKTAPIVTYATGFPYA